MSDDQQPDKCRDWEDDTFLYGEKSTTTTATTRPTAVKRRKTTSSSKPETVDLIDQSVSEIENFLENPVSRKVKKESVKCRACIHGYFQRKDSKLVGIIARLIRTYAYSISLDALLEEIYHAGERDREETIAGGEEDPGEWTLDEIEYHLFNCMKDPGLFCLKQIIDLKRELDSLGKHLWKVNADGVREPDKNVFILLFQTQKQIKDFLTMAPEKTISFNPRLNVQHHSKKTTQ